MDPSIRSFFEGRALTPDFAFALEVSLYRQRIRLTQDDLMHFFNSNRGAYLRELRKTLRCATDSELEDICVIVGTTLAEYKAIKEEIMSLLPLTEY